VRALQSIDALGVSPDQVSGFGEQEEVLGPERLQTVGLRELTTRIRPGPSADGLPPLIEYVGLGHARSQVASRREGV